MLTLQELTEVLPPHLKTAASQELVDMVNGATTDPEVAREIRGNFVTYTSVLKEGRFRIEDYVNAVAYVSYKLMGYSNRESYVRTFPDRYAALVARGATEKDISAYVAAFHKNKLVNLVLEQSLIPSWVLNQDAYQKAINTQVDIMNDPKSGPMARTQAANSILTHLKRPEKKEIGLNIGLAETSGMTELKDMLTALAERQQAAIGKGLTTREIAHQPLIEGTMKDVTPIPDADT